jgi:hypothetical protein
MNATIESSNYKIAHGFFPKKRSPQLLLRAFDKKVSSYGRI